MCNSVWGKRGVCGRGRRALLPVNVVRLGGFSPPPHLSVSLNINSAVRLQVFHQGCPSSTPQEEIVVCACPCSCLFDPCMCVCVCCPG